MYNTCIEYKIYREYMKLMSLLRFIFVPLLKVILLSLAFLHFRVALKASNFSKSLVALSIEFHTTVPPGYFSLTLYSMAIVFFHFTSSDKLLDSTKVKTDINLLLSIQDVAT